MQSALRSTLSSSRLRVRPYWLFITVFALAVVGFGPAALAQDDTGSRPTPTTTTLSSRAMQESTAAGRMSFSARVSPVPQSAVDRGSVTFLDTGADGQVRSLGSAVVGADGTASLTVLSLGASGAHAVRALYSGSADAAASTSAAAAVTAPEVTVPTFSLSATPTTLNLDAGAQGTVAVTIAPGTGFSNYVSLSCAGLPLYTTCTFLPSNVQVSGVSGLSTMTLSTTAPSGHTALLRRDTGFVYAFLLPGALGLIGLTFGRGRGLRTLAMFCVVAGLVGGASSCAQRYRYLNYGPTPNPGTPAGESIIRIYGTSVNGAISTIQCFQLTLNMTSTNTSGTAGNFLTPCS